MNTAYLLLGGNEGDREQNIERAIALLNEHAGNITLRSHIYQTAAWGKTDQPDFLNIAVAMQTELIAENLLKMILQCEQQLGRFRTEKWGQRTIDIDILFYNNSIIQQEDLTIPHPYLHERRFALVPLNEIAPSYIHPILKQSVTDLLAICPDMLEVTRFN